MRVLLDCTGLHADPLLTGIQRVTRNMLRHWPRHGAELCAVRFDPARGLLAIDPPSVALLLEEHAGDRAALRRELRDRAAHAVEQPVSDDTLVVVPDVFFDPARAWFYRERLRRNPNAVALLSYDFIPWLQPDLFPLHTVVPLMPYLRLVRDARHVAFISEQTKQSYLTRILHRPDQPVGPVLPLGADGLGMERQSWSPDRLDYVALGSIDGRKNQHLIVQAFEALWRGGNDARLTLLGRVFEGADRTWLDGVMHDPRFRWIDHPSQEDVAAVLRRARATIYVSAAEGFGLPPVESLHVGIPVVAIAGMPSLDEVPTDAFRSLPAAEPVLIAEAISALMDDGRAEALWQRASAVCLPTWDKFGAAAASWITSVARATGQPGEAGAASAGGHRPQRPEWTRRIAPPMPLGRYPAPAVQLRPSPLRRAIRLVLRSFRFVAAPLLHRLDARIRSAVDRSATAEAVRELAKTGLEQQKSAAATLDKLQAELAEQRAMIAQLLQSRPATDAPGTPTGRHPTSNEEAAAIIHPPR